MFLTGLGGTEPHYGASGNSITGSLGPTVNVAGASPTAFSTISSTMLNSTTSAVSNPFVSSGAPSSPRPPSYISGGASQNLGPSFHGGAISSFSASSWPTHCERNKHVIKHLRDSRRVGLISIKGPN